MKNRIRDKFTQVDNKVLDNKEITLKAKGLYAFLCSKPDNWDFSYNGLTFQLQEGEKAIRSAIKELVDLKVLLRVSKKINNSFAGWDWIINPNKEDLENGIDPISKLPKQEVPKIGTSQNGYEISNTNPSNTKISNNITSNEVIEQGSISNNIIKNIIDEAVEKEYGNRIINESLLFLKTKIGIDDFKENRGIQGMRMTNIIQLTKKIGKEELIKRLNSIMEDDFKIKNCNSIGYLYKELKAFIRKETINKNKKSEFD